MFSRGNSELEPRGCPIHRLGTSSPISRGPHSSYSGPESILHRLTGSVWSQSAAELATRDPLTRQEARKEKAGGRIEIQGEETEEEEI